MRMPPEAGNDGAMATGLRRRMFPYPSPLRGGLFHELLGQLDRLLMVSKLLRVPQR